MPMPNDFRAIGPLGGYFAGLEFADEREKSELAKLMTQAQTGQVNQATDQAQQLLPLLLQQREQENQIRAKSALEAQLGMANVPQEVANQGLAGVLTGMQTQDKITSQPEEARLAGLERKGKGLGLQQQNLLKSLEQVDYIRQTQGDIAAAISARELGLNAEKVQQAIKIIKGQQMNTSEHMQNMSKEELKAVTEIEKSNISAGASRYVADKSAGAREAEAAARREAQASALSVEKRFTEAEKAYIAAGRPAVGPVAEEYAAAHNAWTWKENMRQPATSYLDPDTGEIRRETPASRPAPARLTPQGSGGNPQADGTGKNKLSPEDRAKLIKELKGQ